MANDLQLSIILPSYLEEENLRLLLPRIQRVIALLAVSAEVLVIDATTPLDNTREVCEEWGAKHIHRECGNLFGDAVRTGIRRAQGQYIVFMDADGSHPPEFIRELWRDRERADVVIASRYTDGGTTDNNRLLVLMSLMVNLAYSVVLGLHCKDVSNSFKLYRASLLKELELSCKHFDIVEEILYKMTLHHRPLQIVELPFSFKKRMFGTTKRNLLLFMFSFLITLLRLRFSR